MLFMISRSSLYYSGILKHMQVAWSIFPGYLTGSFGTGAWFVSIQVLEFWVMLVTCNSNLSTMIGAQYLESNEINYGVKEWLPMIIFWRTRWVYFDRRVSWWVFSRALHSTGSSGDMSFGVLPRNIGSKLSWTPSI